MLYFIELKYNIIVFENNNESYFEVGIFSFLWQGKSRGESSGTLTYGALRNKYSVLDFAHLIFLACCAIMGQSLFRAATLHPLRDEEMTVHELWNMPSTENQGSCRSCRFTVTQPQRT